MKHLPIPEAALAQHAIVVGKTGAGKSSALRVLVEHLLDQEQPVCIVDPKGDWYGIKSSATGKHAGYPVVIFGGEHADVPINEHSGAHVAEIVATGNRPCLIDLGGWMVGERTRFFIRFAGAFFKHARGLRHLVVDEAHNFAPQGRIQDPDSGKMLHWANRLASEGRGRGITLLAASQRPQKVHKDFVTSCETLIAMRVIHKLDRNAIKDWIDGCADPDKGREVLGQLAGMKRGEAWVWSPEIEFGPEQVAFPMFRTYDSFQPQAASVELKGWAAVDLDDVKAKLADVVAEAEANDPAFLTKRIRELEQELKRAGNGVDHSAEVAQLQTENGQLRDYIEILEASVRARDEVLAAAAEAAAAAADLCRPELEQPLRPPARGVTKAQRPVMKQVQARPRPAAPARSGQSSSNSSLSKGERIVLTAIASYPDGVDRDQMFVLTGYKSTSIDTYLKRLRAAGHIDTGWPARATSAGIAALGPDFAPLPTGPALIDHWRGRLSAGELKIFDAIVIAYPQGLTKGQLQEITDYRSTSVDTYMKRLRARRLAEKRGREWCASDTLF